MGRVLPKGKAKVETPAPCDYQGDVRPPRTPSYSITPRRKDTRSELINNMRLKSLSSVDYVGPSPNTFNISRGQNHKGRSTGVSYSLSSRHSPYKYSGFPSTALARL